MSDLQEAFEWYADWAADVSPLYERLARCVASDPDLRALAEETPEGQPAPQLLLAAVHAELLEGADHPLSAFYPTCRDDPRPPTEGSLGVTFRDFCLEREATIRETVARRRVQTNEVGRSAILLPAFGHVARETDADRIAFVEIGTSAGLNLYWDRYRYEYDGRVAGDTDSPVHIESSVRGDVGPPLPERLPEVVSRVGIDLEPLDVTDPDDARWLRALVVPDQRERHERLRAAIDLVADDPPDLVAGDAAEVLPSVLADLQVDVPVCVYSTLTLYQFDDGEVADLRATLADRSQTRDRPVHWLSGDPDDDGEYPTCRHVAFCDGEASERRLARFQSYGEWIEWLDDGA